MRLRASVIAFDGDRTLVMLRRKQGRDYATLVGGGIEPGEKAEQAALRELREETGLEGVIVRRLRDAVPSEQAVFLVSCSGAPVLGGHEAEKANPWNRYEPAWVPVAGLDVLGLRPDGVAELIRESR